MKLHNMKDPNGVNLDLCVLHQISPNVNSEQSMSIVLGLSLCEDHMRIAINAIIHNRDARDLLLAAENGEL